MSEAARRLAEKRCREGKFSRVAVDTRLWAKVDKGDEDWHCWEWTGALDKDGYGAIYHNGRNRRAHRLAYRLSNLYPIEPLVVMHLCNNRTCVNPLHLRGATQRENLGHMAACGRARGKITRGEDASNSKLTDAIVRSILTDERTYREIAENYGVNPSLIGAIKSGRKWKHVTQEGPKLEDL